MEFDVENIYALVVHLAYLRKSVEYFKKIQRSEMKGLSGARAEKASAPTPIFVYLTLVMYNFQPACSSYHDSLLDGTSVQLSREQNRSKKDISTRQYDQTTCEPRCSDVNFFEKGS